MKRFLSSENMCTMYIMFVRSIMEYGSVLFSCAASTHLAKLDNIQAAAERMGGFQVDSLKLRREAAGVSLALKMLDGDCRAGLYSFAPTLTSSLSCHSHKTKRASALSGIQVVPLVLSDRPLDLFRDGFLGSLPGLWAKLPQSLLAKRAAFG